MAFGRKKTKQAADDGAEQTLEADVPVEQRGTISLVLEPGRVKHVHFDGRNAPAAPAPEPRPEPVALPEAAPAPVPAGRRSTLYETDRGNQVVAYESGDDRKFATTSPWGERPFDPATDVDPLVKDVPLERTYHEVIPVAPVEQVPPRVVESAWEPAGGPRVRTLKSTEPKKAKKARKARKPTRKPVVRKVKRAPRKPHSDFPGDDHLVIDLEGIGPVYAKRLQKQGVYTTSRLAFEKPGNLAKRIKAPRKLVKNWRNMAELIKVKGIGKQYAEVLVRAGVKGIDDLKQREPEALSKKVNKFLRSVDTTVIGTGVHAKRAKGWIKAAKPMRRRPIPVPRKGPPQTETVKGFIQKLPKYGSKPKKAAKASKAKASRKPARKVARKAKKATRKKR